MLTIQNLCWSLPDGTPILDGIDLQIPAGKLTVVTGPNDGGFLPTTQLFRTEMYTYDANGNRATKTTA